MTTFERRAPSSAPAPSRTGRPPTTHNGVGGRFHNTSHVHNVCTSTVCGRARPPAKKIFVTAGRNRTSTSTGGRKLLILGTVIRITANFSPNKMPLLTKGKKSRLQVQFASVRIMFVSYVRQNNLSQGYPRVISQTSRCHYHVWGHTLLITTPSCSRHARGSM